MFTKIMLIKKDINNIFHILNKIIMHIFLLFIDIEFVIQFAKLQKYCLCMEDLLTGESTLINVVNWLWPQMTVPRSIGCGLR